MPPVPAFADAAAAIGWIAAQRNDLEPPARALAPVIGDVLDRLATSPGCGLARMSGSGATCFGIFETEQAARAAADAVRRDRPSWWTVAAPISDTAAVVS